MLFSGDTGVLLHPTSLPGKWGIGTLGSEAAGFARWMADSGISVWQVLPLSPPVYANSPYQSLSSFAGNPLLISPAELFQQGFLSASETASTELKNTSHVSWQRLSDRKQLLELAALRAIKSRLPGFEEFALRKDIARWSQFAASRSLNNEVNWAQWEKAVHPGEESMLIHAMIQFFFHLQWKRLKKYCNSLGIRIMGDIPIYTAHDSADVFFNRNLFKLRNDGMPAAVAGVPPDYFSSTGQLWGNPVYDWEKCAASGYTWWTARMKAALDMFDSVRIDHFRGFAEYWEIPAEETTAVNGKWIRGPGYALFQALESRLGRLPVVAEDLGLITPSVHLLRKQCGFPGMTVLQFALQDPGFSLKNVSSDTVIYTGTHDNDTTAGWIESSGYSKGSVNSLVSMALSSGAGLAVLPMQDILELDSTARMNTPSTTQGNWSWRMTKLPDRGSFSR